MTQRHYSEILPHEHYGSSRLGGAATGPTYLATPQKLLIVQPEVEADASSLYSEEELLPQTGAFHVHALSLHCHLQSSSIEVVACYDRKVNPDD